MLVDRDQNGGNGYTVLIKYKQSSSLLLLVSTIRSLPRMRLKCVTITVCVCHIAVCCLTEPPNGECGFIWKHYFIRVLLQYCHYSVLKQT